MTATDRAAPGRTRARALRDDLLDDLRQAAPMPTAPMPTAPMRTAPMRTDPIPAAPADVSETDVPEADVPVTDVPEADVSVALAPVRVVSVRQPLDRPEPAGPETPTIEMRLTPLLWWGLRMTTLEDRRGFVVGVGPVQIALAGFRR